jgi:DNA cross-link repair 1C protein
LIEAFKPKEIWPCTVDKVNWSAAQSMSFLFGHLYDLPCKFTHDQAMFRKIGGDKGVLPGSRPETPEGGSAEPARKDVNLERGACSSSSEISMRNSANVMTSQARSWNPAELAAGRDRTDAAPVVSTAEHATRKRRRSDEHVTREHTSPSLQAEPDAVDIHARPSSAPRISRAAPKLDSTVLSPYEYTEAWKQQAFEAAIGTGSSSWNDITLVSVSGHQEREEEL